jgi:hypothetical protein
MIRTRTVPVGAALTALALAACSPAPPAPTGAPRGTAAAVVASATPSAASVTDAGGRRYTVQADGTDTVLRAFARGATTPSAQRRVPGRWALPRVVPGGPLEGLTPDGRHLALESPPTAGRTRFALVPTTLAGAPAVVTLPGEHTFDAWSPSGNFLFTIEHMPPAGSGHYRVRVYDVPGGALQPQPVADKRTLDEVMDGSPAARAATPDGATVATLYLPAAGGGHRHGPFVHLLNTRDAVALCVDLPAEVGTGWSLRHAAGRIQLLDAGGAVSRLIDPVTGELTRP